MIVFNTSKRPVSPYALALHSGVSRGGLRGMGGTFGTAASYDPEPVSAAAMNIIDTISSFFHIGAGRLEADQIVPIQNNVVSHVISPVSDAVNAPDRADLSCQTLTKLLNALLQTKANWLHFLHDSQWRDGRAATQAEATLAPYFDDQERKARALMTTCHYSVTEVITGAPIVPGLEPVTIPGQGESFNPDGSTTTYHQGDVATAGMSTSSMALIGIGLLVVMTLAKKKGF